jgi:hypothetical protein
VLRDDDTDMPSAHSGAGPSQQWVGPPETDYVAATQFDDDD